MVRREYMYHMLSGTYRKQSSKWRIRFSIDNPDSVLYQTEGTPEGGDDRVPRGVL